MAKRGATSELNHDNWDDVDDEKEEAGTFIPCSKTELQNRVIKKAKRSLTNSSGGSNSPGQTPFAKFTGFAGNASPFSAAKTDASSPFSTTMNKDNFSFSSKTDASSPFSTTAKKDNFSFSTKIDPSSPFSTTVKKDNFSFSTKTDASSSNSPFFANVKKDNFDSPSKTDASGFNSQFTNTDMKEEKSNGATLNNQEQGSGDAQPSTPSAKQTEKQTRNFEYYRQLQSLNKSILKWMRIHIDKNSCCDFTPVFNDYKKHMDILNVTYPIQAKEATAISESKPSFNKPSKADVFKDKPNHSGSSNDNSNFKKEKLDDETDYGAHFKSNTTNTSTFSSGMKISFPAPTSSASSIGCTSSSKEGNDAANEEKKTPAPFSFGYFSQAANQSNTDKTFSFACAPVEKQESAENEEAEYVPPKNEFVAVEEDGAVYTKRCKLFFKKDDSYAERGLGNLYLKPIDGKTQLLIRADTSLGNILLNIMLGASLPMSRTGKNNVLLVCIPNPPVDPKKADSKEAIPMLIRVKTAEEADELLETLNKYKS